MKNRKSTLTIIFAILCFLTIIYIAGTISGGSLGYAEKYKFNVSQKQLIQLIEQLKSDNKEFRPPTYYSENDSVNTYVPNFFDVDFYYKDRNTIVHLVVDKDHQDASKSYIYFVSINEGLKGPLYQRINKDLNRDDNLRIKKEFGERILNKLELTYEDKGNGMFIFWK